MDANNNDRKESTDNVEPHTRDGSGIAPVDDMENDIQFITQSVRRAHIDNEWLKQFKNLDYSENKL